MMPLNIKSISVPTQEDVIRARSVGVGHPYYSLIVREGVRPVDESQSARDYRRLLEIVFSRERQLEHAVSLLSEKNRDKVGA